MHQIQDDIFPLTTPRLFAGPGSSDEHPLQRTHACVQRAPVHRAHLALDDRHRGPDLARAAPVYTSTTCYDALDPALTYCESAQLGFAGNQTNGWVWLAAIIAAAVVGWLTARRHKTRGQR